MALALESGARRVYAVLMDFDDFRNTWRHALAASRLSVLGFEVETLELRSAERRFKIHVEPLGGQQTEPFCVSAALSWRWCPLLTARGRTCEEDMLTELLGRGGEELETERPWIRVDVKLSARTPFGKALPMPGKEAWSRWAREALGRLEQVERLLPDEVIEVDGDGRLALLAWQGDPTVRLVCSPAGELRLSDVELSAWQAIDLPRRWNDPEREADDPPDAQIAGLLARVRASLFAWMEVLDHLRPA
ncbi:hypothetical protein BE04_20390 [Sorangium cellulosum]|uniref:Uncharacterized protein n=1 Tax=Sorangium cellulosum TaxID=56 RepID=A0A150PQ67_SORCE|nr:hypothetical protein BE04_20390 [Sorangium cellulosum]